MNTGNSKDDFGEDVFDTGRRIDGEPDSFYPASGVFAADIDSSSNYLKPSDVSGPMDTAEVEEEDEDDEVEIVLDTEAADKGLLPLAPARRTNQYIRPGITPSPSGLRSSVQLPSSAPAPAPAPPLGLAPSLQTHVGAVTASPVTSKPKINVMDLDLDTLNEKPWCRPDADVTDYFNYGFNEETWKLYCQKQAQLRLEQSQQGKAKSQQQGLPAVGVSAGPQLPTHQGQHGSSRDASGGKISGQDFGLAEMHASSVRKPPPVIIPPPGRPSLMAHAGPSSVPAPPTMVPLPGMFKPPMAPHLHPSHIVSTGMPPFGIPLGPAPAQNMFPPSFVPPGIPTPLFDRPPRGPAIAPDGSRAYVTTGSPPYDQEGADTATGGKHSERPAPTTPPRSPAGYAVEDRRNARDEYERRDRKDRPRSPRRDDPGYKRSYRASSDAKAEDDERGKRRR